MSNLLFVVIGLTAGLFSGMFGIGGGILIVPALILLAHFAPHAATGTSLAVFILPIGALGAWTYYKEGNVRVLAAVLIATGVFVGAYFGAKLAQQMSPLLLRRGFAVLLVVMAARLWWQK